MLAVELSKGLDAKKAKVNDRIEARTAADLLAHGRIVVPRNTKIIGHVTQAKAHSKNSPGSTLGITFDRLLLKHGREVPLQMTVQAIARPLRSPAFSNLADASDPYGRLPSAATQNPPGVQSPTLGTYPGITPEHPDDTNLPPSLNPARSTETVGSLDSASRGVVGIKDLSLHTSGSVSVLSSSAANVHLDSGAQIILRVQ